MQRHPELLRPLRAGSRTVRIPPHGLEGDLNVPENASALVVFVHGSGSSHLSPRNRAVARVLNEHHIATFLFDLLTTDEERDRANVFDISLLASRLTGALDWLRDDGGLATLPFGLFGASTGAAAALVVASRLNSGVFAVVSRGGRPDLAGSALSEVGIPVLLLVGERDPEVLELNQEALVRLKGPKRLNVVPGASHLFEEAGTLEEVAKRAVRWFEDYMPAGRSEAARKGGR
ncbi:MAG: dienelactone hydrolase family protein [Alphaproteobacteria bacterium]|nr:dienelactone hydrolase family protein [Alphaproteobacteria bacterium]